MITVKLKDEAPQRLQNIASIYGISLEEALKKCIANTYFLSNKKLQGYTVLLNKESDVREVIL